MGNRVDLLMHSSIQSTLRTVIAKDTGLCGSRKPSAVLAQPIGAGEKGLATSAALVGLCFAVIACLVGSDPPVHLGAEISSPYSLKKVSLRLPNKELFRKDFSSRPTR